ncbi:pyridoxamine 5'-phosphate oxidase family protein [Glaciecola sp. 2405UD65-10]|uniref:pyridoxamine 5'-phosphate oxidase family protein n=1 Tax=Glaciecola sp. 2405UD65-10 TaxID=3397244 RepID=UPI003B594381
MSKSVCSPLWIERLCKAIDVHSAKPTAKFFQVASVDNNGMPKNRTMVFRGLKNGAILAICDKRSEKVSQWESLSRAELCWYFEDTREQFRLACEVVLHSKDAKINNNLANSYKGALEQKAAKGAVLEYMKETALNVWQSLSKQAQEQFSWPHPKVPLDNELLVQSDHESSITDSNSDAANQVHENFVLLMFTPDSVDYLNLYTEPQTRELYTLKGADDWLCTQVNA